MEYTIQKLAKLAGVSTRTLRYYDEIGLLSPVRINSSGYRIYGEKEVDALQQILFFKELGFELSNISSIMKDDSFNRLEALHSHLGVLEQKRMQLNLLIHNVEKTIQSEKGEIKMSNKEKFEGFKKDLVKENEEKYGKEIREKYGDKTVDESNAKMMNLSPEEYQKLQDLAAEISTRLEEAVNNHLDPKGEEGLAIAALHKEWLGFTWPSYSVEAHKGLGQMYVDDERFTAYYDKNVSGCAVFLRDAISEHMK